MTTQKNENYYCVIMAGGVGVRFWPMSKTETPKQFIDILGDGITLLQKTFGRFSKICRPENIYIVTNVMYADLVKKQLPQISDEQLVLEPMRRNTAPCIAYANYKIKQKNPNALIVVAPSDHNIKQENTFIEVITNGLEAVQKNDWLLTIGLRPSYPNTGYGYIQYLEDEPYLGNPSIYAVKMFTEKPKLVMAQQFIESGDFLWNSGIFMWSLKSINQAFEQFLPEINDLFKEAENSYNTPAEQEAICQVYQVCRNISVDYGIMEYAKNVYVYAADFGWSDLGTWGSLYEIREKNSEGNAIVGKKVKTYNTSNCIINMPKDKVVVVHGLEDYIIVENDDILLICPKNEESQIRQVVADVQIDFGDKYV
ncbi:MAG: mannose-1-phosphate guanylyltransferase [Bacteroidales bacterium]|nr:mannose-1-phosphate guanylyltransferase [Bacteroidales bacterium]